MYTLNGKPIEPAILRLSAARISVQFGIPLVVSALAASSLPSYSPGYRGRQSGPFRVQPHPRPDPFPSTLVCPQLDCSRIGLLSPSMLTPEPFLFGVRYAEPPALRQLYSLLTFLSWGFYLSSCH